jgi:phosphatidylglycerol:prolipoprotein diacylglycerol transferase
MLIYNPIDPNIVQIGPFLITWHGLFTVLGVLAGVWLAEREIGRRGIPTEWVWTAAIWVLVGGVVGARLMHVIDRFAYYSQNPWQVFLITEGGLAIWGAILGGLVALLVYGGVRRLPIWPVLDSAAPGLLLGQSIGRLGCLVNGDAWGAPTGADWGIVYTNPKALIPTDLIGVPTHPYPVYEIVWNMLVFALIWRLRRRSMPEGTLFLTYVVLYSLGRFFVSFVRQEAVVAFGLQQAQVISLVALVAGLVLLVVMWRRVPTEAAGDHPTA